MAKVILKDVEKIYPNGFKAVHGINLEINDGEFMVFVGPSGCAKSTTLRMIAGLEEITSGTISIGDKVVNDILPKNREIAMVFQNYALYPHMTVYDNMAFSLKIRKVSKDIIDKKVRETAENLDLEELLKRKPKELSGGQRQRVAVGRAIVRDPKVFLFDEPLSNLDAKLRVHMRVQLSKLHKELKTTMIYVTHDQVEAMTMGDRICVMNFGKIMQVDTPLNLYRYPINKFVAEFIGSPAMNVIEAELLKEGEIVLVKIDDVKLRLPKAKGDKVKGYIGKKIWFGIRPSDINLEVNVNSGEVDGIVDFVENMGSESFAYFKLGAKQFISNIQASYISNIKTDDKIKFMFNMDNCYIFDIDTEKNITL
ncbi:sn-glycerol-3-phosphate ABC transporter ATP-binding protein UgpC [Clostridium botulinum]|nr:sn-glycerol-3-phosphate ABC transporter ATP-binding protein UgpC [Clostridium botulinum]